MKRDLLLVPTYIGVTLFLSAFLAVFFVLYPVPEIFFQDLAYHIYVLDVFLFSMLSLLPFMAVLGLLIIIIRAIKLSTFTSFEFLTYVFLCLAVWLILIPACFFLRPENYVSLALTGKAPSVASIFFDAFSLTFFIENLEMYSLIPSVTLHTIFSDIFFLRNVVINAGLNGKFEYLILASMGLALSSLYSLRFVSKWKLINVSTILLLWCSIIYINTQMYKYNFSFYVETKWSACFVNVAITVILFLIGMVTSLKQKKGRG